MAISCSKCGRQYDVTLFQFGRTINCACGERVGLEHRLNLSAAGDEIKFFADVNVARVVRWLRAIGVDTVWEDAISDKDLVRRAIEERRFILTLDKRLAEDWRVDNVLLLESKSPFEQFCEIVARFNLKPPKELFARCLVCNGFLRSASPEEISAGAPAKIRENLETFRYCPRCRKVYWEGSHTQRMRAAIEEVFARQTY